jgi:hypothetical protein
MFDVPANVIRGVERSIPLDERQNQSQKPNENESKPKYETPRIKVLTEEEVLSAFQVTAAGTHMWWV